VLLQVVFEPGHGKAIHPGRALVLNHPLIRKPQVAAFHYGFHQPASRPRFRPRTGRQVRLGTRHSLGQIPSSLARASLTFPMSFRLHELP